MQTITFYSYKGGVGRTLFVANVANYLARLAQNVFVIDFDLEAPGLHYKFNLEALEPSQAIYKGVVDYIQAFTSGEANHIDINEFVIPIHQSNTESGTINIMPAGDAPSKKYWHKLAKINWHNLFYSESAIGVPLFLELKERINKEFNPDFLLIDSRTGITEVGGIATSLLPDKVVCILLNNRENLDGAREVLRSIKRSPRLSGQAPVEIIPVIARIPKLDKSQIEESLVIQVKHFLNEEAPNLSDTLNFEEIYILHSEPELQIEETIRVGGVKSPAESPLLRDYLRLLARLVPKERIQPHVTPLIEGAFAKALDEPDNSQQELEALAASYPHAETFKALLKFYRLRNADAKTQLSTAEQLWDVSGSSNDLIWKVIKEHFNENTIFTSRSPQPSLEFIEAAWREAGSNDVQVGLALAQRYSEPGQRDRGLKVLRDLLENDKANPDVVVTYINELRIAKRFGAALEIVEKYKTVLASNDLFQAAWAQLLLALGNVEDIEKATSSGEILLEKLIVSNLSVAIQLMHTLGRDEEVNVILNNNLERAMAEGSVNLIRRVGEMYINAGRVEEFEKRVRGTLGAEVARQVLPLSYRRRFPRY